MGKKKSHRTAVVGSVPSEMFPGGILLTRRQTQSWAQLSPSLSFSLIHMKERRRKFIRATLTYMPVVGYIVTFMRGTKSLTYVQYIVLKGFVIPRTRQDAARAPNHAAFQNDISDISYNLTENITCPMN